MFGELKRSIKRRIIVRRTVRTNIRTVKKGLKLPKWFCIKMDIGESHSNVSFTVRHTVTKLSINHNVWRVRGAGAESNRGPACQPNAYACVYVCVCVGACTDTCEHDFVYVSSYTSILIYTYTVYARARVCVCTRVCLCGRELVRVRVCVCSCRRLCECERVCVSVCVSFTLLRMTKYV